MFSLPLLSLLCAVLSVSAQTREHGHHDHDHDHDHGSHAAAAHSEHAAAAHGMHAAHGDFAEAHTDADHGGHGTHAEHAAHDDHSDHDHGGHTHGSHELYQPPTKDRKDGITPLMGAILKNQINAATMLIDEEGTDVNAQNAKGITALMFAIGKGQMQIAKLLLEKGADLAIVNVDGLTALQIAVGIEKLDMVDMLIDAGADIVALCNTYPKAKTVYKKLVSGDLLSAMHVKCGIANDPVALSDTVDYFMKHGLTKFYEVALLDADEIEKIPAGEEYKEQLVSCIDKMKVGLAAQEETGKSEL
jgi:hypothetical protein